FFQAEDGIRDFHVTGVQTCALPISTGQFYRRFVAVVAGIEHDGLVARPDQRLHGTEDRFGGPRGDGDLAVGVALHAVDTRNLGQIGRASCRERVEVWEVAGAVQENT